MRDVHDAGEEEEEVHGGVVPVGEVSPAVRLGAVQLQVGTGGNKLLDQYPWAERVKDKLAGNLSLQWWSRSAQRNVSEVPSQSAPPVCS